MSYRYETCEKCRYFGGGSTGDCKRHAPAIADTSANWPYGRAYPQVAIYDWCGDFVNKCSCVLYGVEYGHQIIQKCGYCKSKDKKAKDGSHTGE